MRARTTWALFAVAVAVVLGVMGGVTWAVLDLDTSAVAEAERCSSPDPAPLVTVNGVDSLAYCPGDAPTISFSASAKCVVDSARSLPTCPAYSS